MSRAHRPPRPSSRRVLAVAVLVAVVGAVALLRAQIAAPVRVDSASMVPTYAAGDVVLVSRDPPDPADLHRGELVVFPSPQDGRRTLKRVVGLPGDVVVILDGRLHVNEQPVDERYVDHAMTDGYYSRTVVVPVASVFVLGDNRGNSVDSRDYGSVPIADLSGRVLVRVWPVVG